jgi:hypothetical protein
MDFAAGVYLPEAPPFLGFFWVVLQFCRSESDQIQSVKLLQSIVSN